MQNIYLKVPMHIMNQFSQRQGYKIIIHNQKILIKLKHIINKFYKWNCENSGFWISEESQLIWNWFPYL